ncbi:MAG: hypothetical protein HPY83_08180 [Anaerolineae bacterium]|nr:hypothetical protein [Anaerolineae bacterium]
MTSKERVRAAVSRQPVDKTPIGFYVVDYDTIERVIGRKTYVRNKVESQIAFWEGRRDEVVESYKEDTVEFYRKVGICDLVCFKEAPLVPPKGYVPEDPPRRVADDLWRDSKGRVYKVSLVSNEFTLVEDPTRWTTEYTVEQFEAPIDSTPPDPTMFEAMDYVLEHLGPTHYIAGRSGGLDALVLLGGMERGLMEYLLHPEVVRAAITRSCRQANALDQYYIRPGQDGVLFEEDTSGTLGPLISPGMYREFCLPALRSRVENVKGFGQQVLMHNCGDNRPLLDTFIEAGIECLQSLQTTAGMYVPDLQDRWGDSIAFWGGVATEILIAGTPDDVRANVRDVMTKAGPRGGFILGPSHSIAKGTRYENFMAMLEEFDRLRDT